MRRKNGNNQDDVDLTAVTFQLASNTGIAPVTVSAELIDRDIDRTTLRLNNVDTMMQSADGLQQGVPFSYSIPTRAGLTTVPIEVIYEIKQEKNTAGEWEVHLVVNSTADFAYQ